MRTARVCVCVSVNFHFVARQFTSKWMKWWYSTKANKNREYNTSTNSQTAILFQKNRKDNEYILPLSNSLCAVCNWRERERASNRANKRIGWAFSVSAYVFVHDCVWRCQNVKRYRDQMTTFIRHYDSNWDSIAVIKIQNNDNLMVLFYMTHFSPYPTDVLICVVSWLVSESEHVHQHDQLFCSYNSSIVFGSVVRVASFNSRFLPFHIFVPFEPILLNFPKIVSSIYAWMAQGTHICI